MARIKGMLRQYDEFKRICAATYRHIRIHVLSGRGDDGQRGELPDQEILSCHHTRASRTSSNGWIRRPKSRGLNRRRLNNGRNC
jgi:hypothetical protein